MRLSKKNNFFPIQKLKYFVKNKPNKAIITIDNKSISYKQFYNSCLKFNYKIKKSKKIAILDNEKDKAILAIFSCLMLGITYIPISHNQPINRIKKIVKKSGADTLVITTKRIDYLKIPVKKKINLLNNIYKTKNKYKEFNKNISLKNLAYIIYTSGSTGEPKGVKISRLALNHFSKWLTKFLQSKEEKKFSQFSPLGFDLSVAEVFGSICTGSNLYPVENKYFKTFPAEFIFKNAITNAILVPSYIGIFKQSDRLNKKFLKNIKHFIFCGETLTKSYIEYLFKCNNKLKITNTYGPTEATVLCTAINLNIKNYKKYSKKNVSIGSEINGMKIKLIKKSNSNNKFLGEVVISGPQISSGYYKNNLLNKKKFKNNFSSFYTGDIVEKIDGNLYFINRIDNQIKKDGHRIELDEISNNISKITNKSYCKTIFKKNKIYSFIQSPKKISEKTILFKINKVLPPYMIPSKIIFIENFPINNNGKIDEFKLVKLAI